MSKPTSRPATHLARVDSGSRADVLERRVVDSLGKERVGDLVSTREANTGGVRASSTSDLDLEAAHVWLWVARTGVERKNLSTDKVVAGSDALGNSECALSAVGVEDFSTPGGSGALVAVFSDLEEGAGGGSCGVGNLGHVNQDRAVVGTADGGVGAGAIAGLGVQLYSEGGAGCCC